MIRSHCVGSIGHERYLSRLNLADQVHKCFRRITFDIKLRLQHRLERKDVVLLDVTLVGTRMHRDAVGAEALTVEGKLLYVRHIASASIADSGYFVDIYT